MARPTTTLLLGLTVGAVAVALLYRLRQVAEEEDPETLVDRLARQLDLLEKRVGESRQAGKLAELAPRSAK